MEVWCLTISSWKGQTLWSFKDTADSRPLSNHWYLQAILHIFSSRTLPSALDSCMQAYMKRMRESLFSSTLYLYHLPLLISLHPQTALYVLKSFYNSLGICLAPKFQYPQLVGLYKTLFRNKIDNLIYLIRVSPSKITQITHTFLWWRKSGYWLGKKGGGPNPGHSLESELSASHIKGF